MEGVKDTFRHWRLVLRCSALGTYIGVIPGMGGGVSQWIAYAHAVQSSPDKSRFGKGAVEGVLGPGAANNSTLGGALIPTIAFGVPGSVTMAILLGAFIIQGLVPGPPMLIPESQGGHLTLTFSFVWIVVVTNIITVTVCLLFLKQLAMITLVRGGLIIPFITLLVYLCFSVSLCVCLGVVYLFFSVCVCLSFSVCVSSSQWCVCVCLSVFFCIHSLTV